MEKINTFKFMKHQLEYIGLYRPGSIDKSSFLKYKYPFFVFLIGVINVLLGIPLFSSKSVGEFATRFMGFGMNSSLLVCDSVLTSMKPEIYRMIENFEEIIRKRSERIDLKIAYGNMTHKIGKLIKFMQIFQMISCNCPLPLLYLDIVFIHFTRGLETADYRLPAQFWLPIDWKASLLGYSVAWALNVVVGFIFYESFIISMPLLVGCFFSTSEMIHDIKREIATLNENWKTNRNQVELMEKLCETVWFNARINQCIQELAEVFNLIFFCNFVFSLAFICNSFMLFQIELTKDKLDMGVIGISIVTTIFSFGLVFIFCELGEQLSTQSKEIYDTICELDWDSFPFRAQRMMPMILLTTQHPNNLTAYGGIACARDTFKKVVNTGYTYFTVFRG